MAIFGPKPWLTQLEKCQFFDFLIFWFLDLRKAFFRSRIWSKTFSWSILPKKKKLEKWSFLDQNHGLTPLEKWQFFVFLNLLLSQPRKAFFRFIISKKTFSWPILKEKKEAAKMAMFVPKPWVNPFRKMVTFRLFELPVCIPQQCVFSFQNILKDILMPCFAEKNKLKKWLLLDQNKSAPFFSHLQKWQFLDFSNFLF